MADIPYQQSNIVLYVTSEKFFLGNEGSEDGIISIDRVTQELKFSVTKCEIPSSACHKRIFGLLGTIKLIAGNYLVVVTGRRNIGSINGQPIWMITNTEVISYTKTYLHLNEKQLSANRTYLNMVNMVLNTPYLYFSYTYDLTHSLQRLQHTSPEFVKRNTIGARGKEIVRKRHPTLEEHQIELLCSVNYVSL